MTWSSISSSSFLLNPLFSLFFHQSLCSLSWVFFPFRSSVVRNQIFLTELDLIVPLNVPTLGLISQQESREADLKHVRLRLFLRSSVWITSRR